MTGWRTGLGADDRAVSIGGFPSLTSSVLAAFQKAGEQMSAAADAIAAGPDNYVDASMDMSSAKLTMGVAAALFKVDNEMQKSTLNMLV